MWLFSSGVYLHTFAVVAQDYKFLSFIVFLCLVCSVLQIIK
jgi:hypothetical protein